MSVSPGKMLYANMCKMYTGVSRLVVSAENVPGLDEIKPRMKTDNFQWNNLGSLKS